MSEHLGAPAALRLNTLSHRPQEALAVSSQPPLPRGKSNVDAHRSHPWGCLLKHVQLSPKAFSVGRGLSPCAGLACYASVSSPGRALHYWLPCSPGLLTPWARRLGGLLPWSPKPPLELSRRSRGSQLAARPDWPSSLSLLHDPGPCLPGNCSATARLCSGAGRGVRLDTTQPDLTIRLARTPILSATAITFKTRTLKTTTRFCDCYHDRSLG